MAGYDAAQDGFQPTSAGVAAIYARLKMNSGWQTRILEMKPGQFGQPIVASLHVIDLIQNSGAVLHEQQRLIQYEALSYCWGEPEPELDCTISCNGISLPIMQNLHSGLQRLRNTDDFIYLWADAVCINQSDYNERSGQVANMLNIFRKARQVKVWLGQPRDDLLLPSLSEHTAHERSRILHDELCVNPWFRRVWVKQEIWAADDLSVLYGKERLEWDELVASGLGQDFLRPQVFEKSYLEKVPDAAVHYGCDHLVYFPQGYGYGQEDKAADIVSLLARYRKSECRNPRDIIYGVLGMSTTKVCDGVSNDGEQQTGLVVDYNNTVAQVFQSLAEYLSRRDNGLHFLYFNAQFGSFDDRNLPSWVPDWGTIRHTPNILSHLSVMRLYTYDSFLHLYDAPSRWLRQSRRQEMDNFFMTHGVLMVEGWTIGALEQPLSEEQEITHFEEGYRTRREKISVNVARLSDLKGFEPFETKLPDFFSWITPILEDRRQREPELPAVDEASIQKALPDTWVVPSSASTGDIIAFVDGGDLPLVLRPLAMPSTYTYVGPATASYPASACLTGEHMDRMSLGLHVAAAVLEYARERKLFGFQQNTFPRTYRIV